MLNFNCIKIKNGVFLKKGGNSMEMKLAKVSDAPIIHELMMKAFDEYKNEIPPSSALNETVQSITDALNNGEQSLIGFIDNVPVAMVRFLFKEEGLYFFRLSVIPEKQGQGIAKKLLQTLEKYAIQNRIPAIFCKVRMNVQRNIQLYESLGYTMTDEETINRNGIKFKVVTMLKKL